MEDVFLLAGAYLAVGRAGEADSLLARARQIVPSAHAGLLFQALAEEALGHTVEARTLYSSYLQMDRPAFTDEARGRLDRLDFEALAREIPELLSSQNEGASPLPDSTLVLVLPFSATPGGADVAVMAAAMHELIVGDLEATDLLKVVSRSLARGLMASVPGANQGTGDPDAGEVAGRAVGAGVVIQGRMSDLDGFVARLQINVLVLGPDGMSSVLPAEFEGRWSQLETVQRQVTPYLYQALGVGWTTEAERNLRTKSRPSLEVARLFGEGLMAEDRGDYESAEALFAQSNALDDNFRLARARARRAKYLLAASAPPGEVAWRLAQEAVQRRSVLALGEDPFASEPSLRANAGNRGRSVLGEILGLGGVGAGSVLELIFVSGGGGGR